MRCRLTGSSRIADNSDQTRAPRHDRAGFRSLKQRNWLRKLSRTARVFFEAAIVVAATKVQTSRIADDGRSLGGWPDSGQSRPYVSNAPRFGKLNRTPQPTCTQAEFSNVQAAQSVFMHFEWRLSLATVIWSLLVPAGSFALPAWATKATGVFSQYAPCHGLLLALLDCFAMCYPFLFTVRGSNARLDRAMTPILCRKVAELTLWRECLRVNAFT